MATYLCGSVWVVYYFKVMECMVMQCHARSCNVKRGHASSCIVMQNHARSRHATSCMVSHTPTWLTLLSCHVVLPLFRLFQAIGERGLSTTGGLRNLCWSLFMFLLPETILIRWTRKSNFLQFRWIKEREGAWSIYSDWGHLVLMIGLSRSSGSLLVSDNLCVPCRSSHLPLLINLSSSDLAGRNAWPLVY